MAQQIFKTKTIKTKSIMYYELEPAYGRDYKTKAEVESAWNEGKDFNGDFQLGFKPVNINDIPKPCTVNLRYAKNRKVHVVNVGN